MHRSASFCSAVLLATIIAGCSESAPAPAPPPTRTVELPAVDESGLDPTVAARLEQCRVVVREVPDSADAWGRLGIVHDIHGQTDAAITCYEHAEALDPNAFAWPYYHAICVAETDPVAAAVLFASAMDRNLGHAPGWVRVGRSRLAAGDDVGAVDAFQRAIGLDETLVTAHLGLARAKHANDDAAGALAALDAAVALEPASREPAALRNVILVELDRADEQQSIASDRPELEPLPDSVRRAAWWDEGRTMRWRIARSDVLRAEGRLDELLSEWQEAVRLDPTSVEARIALGRARFDRGEIPMAIARFARTVEMEPSNPAAHVRLAEAYAAQQRFDDAIRHYGQSLDATEDRAVRRALAMTFVQSGDLDEGFAQLERLAEAGEDRAVEFETLTRLMIGHGRARDAVRVYQRAVEEDPSARRWFDYGLLLASTDRNADATGAFTRSIELDPDHPAAYLNVARTLRLSGDEVGAAAQLRTAHERFPLHVGTGNAYAWLLATSPDEDLRDGEASLLIVQSIIQRDGQHIEHLDTAAAAYAELGRFDDAVTMIDHAIKVASREDATKPLVADYQARRALYENQQPYRETNAP